ncbi:MAG: peptidoglycan-binding protein [Burkholderiales bacterium]|nr:peptidoglycan-binding protein [Burkholderiales bacterium]
MPATLSIGSMGPLVKQLQEGLNQLASQLPKLAPDGQFGPKTRGRVQEFQTKNQLVPDGIVGPLTWDVLLQLLQQVAQGGVPTMPGMTSSVFDALRPLVLLIAQQHMGKVDFGQLVNGRPKGIDFVKEVFDFAAGVKLTDANFREGGTSAGNWIATPWVGNTAHVKSWCGIFAIYCYRKAGIPVHWDIGKGGPVGPLRMRTFSPGFASKLKPGDIGSVRTKSHHFLIESINSQGPLPPLTTIDGNTDFGRIQRRNAHKVGQDNFNAYEFTQ